MWAWEESNLRPRSYQERALTTEPHAHQSLGKPPALHWYKVPLIILYENKSLRKDLFSYKTIVHSLELLRLAET